MAWVADYTSRIPPAALKAAGVVGVCRYVSRSAWKVIGNAEYDELRAAGIAVVLNFEDEAAGWLGGAAAGTADAAFAASAAKALGYPAGSPIPSSADFDMTAGQWASAGRAYAVAYRDGLLAHDYAPGVYGPWDVLTWCRDDAGYGWFWQAGMSTAWSGGRNANAWPGAHLRQRYHQTVGGLDVDHNDILRDDWSGLDMAQLDDIQTTLEWVNRRVEAIANGYPTLHGKQPQVGSPMWLVPTLTALGSRLDAIEAKLDALAQPPLAGDVTVTGTLHVQS